MTNKISTDRVKALRDERHKAGFKQRNLYAHDDDWPAIKAFADELRCKRVNAELTKLNQP